MAITKTNATVEGMNVLEDGSIEAKVIFDMSDDATDPATVVTRARTTLVVTDATNAEKSAAARVVVKAQALAVA
jgi:hypothetical protein